MTLDTLQQENASLKKQKTETVSFLKQLSKEVGMIWGPEIEKHLAKLNGQAFQPSNWNVEDRNGEQGR